MNNLMAWPSPSSDDLFAPDLDNLDSDLPPHSSPNLTSAEGFLGANLFGSSSAAFFAQPPTRSDTVLPPDTFRSSPSLDGSHPRLNHALLRTQAQQYPTINPSRLYMHSNSVRVRDSDTGYVSPTPPGTASEYADFPNPMSQFNSETGSTTSIGRSIDDISMHDPGANSLFSMGPMMLPGVGMGTGLTPEVESPSRPSMTQRRSTFGDLKAFWNECLDNQNSSDGESHSLAKMTSMSRSKTPFGRRNPPSGRGRSPCKSRPASPIRRRPNASAPSLQMAPKMKAAVAKQEDPESNGIKSNPSFSAPFLPGSAQADAWRSLMSSTASYVMESNNRPNYKRLPNQTLGPENSKRRTASPLISGAQTSDNSGSQATTPPTASADNQQTPWSTLIPQNQPPMPTVPSMPSRSDSNIFPQIAGPRPVIGAPNLGAYTTRPPTRSAPASSQWDAVLPPAIRPSPNGDHRRRSQGASSRDVSASPSTPDMGQFNSLLDGPLVSPLMSVPWSFPSDLEEGGVGPRRRGRGRSNSGSHRASLYHSPHQVSQRPSNVRTTRKQEVGYPGQNEGDAGHRERGGSQMDWMGHSSTQTQNDSNMLGDAIPDPSIVALSAISSTAKAQCHPQMIGHKTPLDAIIAHLVEHGCLDVSEQLNNIDEHSRYSGSLSDVYQARWTDGSLVAVKCLRALSSSDIPPGKLLKHTARELYTWSRADHPNILKLHGLAMCTQIATGLSYMHNLGLVHGDVKGNNVVVSEAGVAKLTDFGSTTMTREFEVAFTATQTVNYSIRWAAPELFLSQSSSFETDVYAFAKTVLEALTGDVPHKGLSDLAIMRSVGFEGKFPDRPMEHIPPQSKKGDELWNMLVRCWSTEPAQRPTIDIVREFMNGVTQEDLRVAS